MLALFLGVLEECGCESLDSRRRSWGGCGWKIDKGAYKGQGFSSSCKNRATVNDVPNNQE